MHLSKPSKLYNKHNPGGHFMSHTMYNAKEVLTPGPSYDVPEPFHDDYYATHDHQGYIGADRAATVAAASMNIPVSMFVHPTPPPHHQRVHNNSNFYPMHQHPFMSGRDL